ncbi:hypothetical protein ACJDT4_04105 [Clostridium neuense]|uniref:DUF3784 domain-containing protein n=2 Tax=Clostridium neuense TaxID=1728934 RepID=A0ABW8TAZ4_9CLOT
MNTLLLFVLIAGIMSFLTAIISPSKLLKLTKEYNLIKNEKGFTKYTQKLYSIFGLMCIIISLLTLFKIIDNLFFAIIMCLFSIAVSFINPKAIKKYSQK